MYRHLFVVFSLLFILSHRLAGQEDSSGIKVFSGSVVDDSLGILLPFAHIWNESTRQSGFSNDHGEFSIKVRGQDTLVFTTLGYFSEVVVVSNSSLNHPVEVRLSPKRYEIGEVVVRRFRNYESFKYQVLNLDLPEEKTADLQAIIKVTSTAAALEADRERAVKDKQDGFGSGFGYVTPLGRGIDREKAFKEKMSNLKKREQVIAAKFNRVLVGDITKLEGDELTEFIAFCNFSEDYLYESDLYAITDALYAKFNAYQNRPDTIPAANKDQEFDRN